MTLQVALKKALGAVRDRRAAYLQTASVRYRLIPSTDHPRGYVMNLSIRYNDEWQPWSVVEGFGVDDILCEKWTVV